VLPPKLPRLPDDQQALLRLYRRLDGSGRESLLSFAEFLVHRTERSDEAPGGRDTPPAPLAIPRPETETVVAAIRRLTRTYPMLDKGDLLHEASELMTAHVMQGRSAGEVIDELEVTFRRHYEHISRPGQSKD
jgi:hypothetical protein